MHYEKHLPLYPDEDEWKNLYSRIRRVSRRVHELSVACIPMKYSQVASPRPVLPGISQFADGDEVPFSADHLEAQVSATLSTLPVKESQEETSKFTVKTKYEHVGLCAASFH